jgi:hypothetical protein
MVLLSISGRAAAMTIDDRFGTDGGSPPLLREMLYVDTSRVRSYLAQMEQGVPERVQRAEEGVRRWAAGVNVMAFRAEAGGQSSGGQQTERTLSDLHFAIFEDVATSIGFLTDISDSVTDPDAWTSGRLHASLQEGHAIRVTAPTRLTDGEHIIALVKKFTRVTGQMNANSPGGTEEAAAAQLYATMTDAEATNEDEQFSSELEAMVRLLFDTGVWVRCMPCGAGYPEACFSGVLLDRSEYIDPERFAIFSRYGSQLREWTVVGTVTRISTPAPIPDMDLKSLTSEVLTPQGLVDRNRLEDTLSRLLAYCEAHGITEGPRWPSIVITPLAVYRQVMLPPVTDESPEHAR